MMYCSKLLDVRWMGVLLLAAMATGCGKGEHFQRLPVVPVEGEVSFDGKPVAGALVVFHPVTTAETMPPPARGTVRDDGTFHLTTYDADDGAAPGEYKVTVEWRRLVDQGGDVKAGPNLLPARYGRSESTDLHVRVSDNATKLPPLKLRR